MNKIIIILITLVLVISGLYYYFRQEDQDSINSVTSPTQTPLDDDDRSLDFEPSTEIDGYQIKSLLIRNPANIHLYSNLTDRLSTPEAMAKNNCSDLVTAGFYTEEFEHIGLLVSNNDLLSEARLDLNSSGYFSIDSQDNPTISSQRPQNPRLAVQTYPILKLDGNLRTLNNTTTDKARRIVVATTNKNEVVFIVVYESRSVFDGPTLRELPGIISDYQENENLQLTNVLNLDGGTHSAIISRFIKLPELSTVGSYFCMRY